MTFALAAVAEPLNVPPRIALTVTESDADVSIQSVAFFRDGVPLRFDAAVTGDIAVAYDYDAPFDVALLYRADGVELGSPVDFTETWPDLSAWSGEVASWSVAAGVASSSDPGKAIWRETTSGDPITAVEVTALSGAPLEIVNNDGDAAVVSVIVVGTSVKLFGTTGTEVIGSGDFTLTLSANSATVTGTGWSATVPYSGESSKRLQLVAPESGTGSVEDIVVRIGDGDPADVTDSDTVTLSPTGDNAGVWLTNAAVPVLAILAEHYPLSGDDPFFIVTPGTRESTQYAANSVQLEIEGSADVLTTTLGPRRRGTWPLVVGCTTPDAWEAMEAFLANSSVISLRVPSGDRWRRLNTGFYAVGDVESTRIGHPQMGPVEAFVLPLTPSRAPKFKPLWQWSWDTLAQTGMTWDDVAANFATWNDVLIGPN